MLIFLRPDVSIKRDKKKNKNHFEFYVAAMGDTLQQQKATLPLVCATCKGALTPPLSVTARSLTRINGHSKHLFQTYVFDMFVSVCCVNTETQLKSSRGEKDKSLVMPSLEYQRLASPSRRKPRAIKPYGEKTPTTNHTGRKPLQQTIRGGNPYNKPDHVPR
jgi:hypothetical protein